MKKLRLILLSLGLTLMVLGLGVLVQSRRTGNPELQRIGLLYLPLGAFCLLLRSLLAWLKRRRKLAVRRRRAERQEAASRVAP